MSPAKRSFRAVAGFALILLAALPLRALADADDVASPNSTTLGLQPIRGPIPAATPAPGESAVVRAARRRVSSGARRARPHENLPHRRAPRAVDAQARPDGDGQHLQRRGSGAGASSCDQGDTRRHRLHQRRHQPPIRSTCTAFTTFPSRWTASAASRSRSCRTAATSSTASSPISRARSSITRTTTKRCSTRGSTARSSSSRRIRRRTSAVLAHDFLEIVSSWQIQSGAENHFTLNGKEYPATRALDVRAGERFRIRWINISGEEFHTMHTHGHYQQIIARDAAPVTYRRHPRYRAARAGPARRRRRQGRRETRARG